MQDTCCYHGNIVNIQQVLLPWQHSKHTAGFCYHGNRVHTAGFISLHIHFIKIQQSVSLALGK